MQFSAHVVFQPCGFQPIRFSAHVSPCKEQIRVVLMKRVLLYYAAAGGGDAWEEYCTGGVLN